MAPPHRLRFRDRVLGWFGLQRKAGAISANAYHGAVANRLTADWIFATTASADQDLRGDHRRLVARSRELVRNNGYAERFVGMVEENVIGHAGIRLQAQVKNAAGVFDQRINDAIEDAWEDWGYPENCSADGRLSWIDAQQLAVRTLAQDGEVIVRMLPGFDNPHGFAVQVLDADYLDVDFNREPGTGQNEIRMGVEIDRWGRPVAYHLFTSHPGDTRNSTMRRPARERIDARYIRHLALQKRPGQTRGVTWFAPVLLPLRMLDGYHEAELVAARTAAAKMGFFVPGEGADVDPTQPQPGTTYVEAEPGAFGVLPQGYEFQSWDPQHPNSAFRDFAKAILRMVAAGAGISYNSLANDLEAVNYSSIRAGLLSERDVWRKLQTWVACQLHRPVYLEWFRWALTTGALDLPARNVSRWTRHKWLPRGWPWVDPEKDINAAILAIGARLDSRTRIAAENGRDFEEVLADLDRENDLMRQYDVMPVAEAPAPAKRPAEPPPDGGADALVALLNGHSTNGNAHANGNGRLAALKG